MGKLKCQKMREINFRCPINSLNILNNILVTLTKILLQNDCSNIF